MIRVIIIILTSSAFKDSVLSILSPEQRQEWNEVDLDEFLNGIQNCATVYHSEIENCKRRFISRLNSDIETEPVLIPTRSPISFSRYFALHILGDNYLICNIAQKEEIVFAYPMLRENPVAIDKLHILFVNRKRCYKICIC